MLLTGGNVHDIIGARALLALVATPRWLIGDKAYGAADLHDFLTLQGCEAVIPPKIGCRSPRPFDPVRYRSRNIIERSFNPLKDWRGIATRYDKTARNFLAGTCLAAAITYWAG